MWPDNETEIDLLGFDYLIDELLVLLKEPRLLPVTIGVTGDWGSGKSSLLAMAANTLAREKDATFIVVRFSPWKFEGYEDIKAALMQEVMRGLLKAVRDDKTNLEKSKELFLRLVKRVNWFAIARRVGTSYLAAHTGVPLEAVAVTAVGWIDTADLEGIAKPPESDEQIRQTSVAEFRDEFEALLVGLEEVNALVVFVDDVDRCMPDTVIETFEAIRLFLHVPKTAYVIAADQRIVQGAIEDRYPTAVRENPSLGRDYLEKILQATVAIPPLSVPEAESYINLLMADAHVSAELMSKLLDAAKVARATGYLSVCMNEGIAKKALGTVDEPLSLAFTVASRISPTLARKHNGNPRQIKRFMNTLMLRQRAAERRTMDLSIAVLAKLMVLEEVDRTAYRQLFAWQAEAGGTPPQIAQAEAYGVGGSPEGMVEDVRAWADRPEVKSWLTLEPTLSDVNLGNYFYFSRDRLSPSLPAARLSPDLQALLANLQSSSDKTRRDAVAATAALSPEVLTEMYPALLAIAHANPAGVAMESAIAVAGRATSVVETLIADLGQIPQGAVPVKLPPLLLVNLKPTPPSLDGLFDAWATAAGPLGKAIAVVRAPKPSRAGPH